MKLRRVTYCLLIGVTLTSVVACATLQYGRSQQPVAPVEPSDTADENNHRTRPATKIVTVNLEGQATQMELHLFHQDVLPFTTYYPVTGFTPEVSQSAQATIVQFYFSPTGTKDDEAYISVFMPSRSVSTQAMQDLILGEQGLLVDNEWELVDRTDIVSYPWATEKLIYQHVDNAEMTVGSIYIGQEAGYTFYIVTHYPVEYGDGFEPRSSIVLENLQFETEN